MGHRQFFFFFFNFTLSNSVSKNLSNAEAKCIRMFEMIYIKYLLEATVFKKVRTRFINRYVILPYQSQEKYMLVCGISAMHIIKL